MPAVAALTVKSLPIRIAAGRKISMTARRSRGGRPVPVRLAALLLFSALATLVPLAHSSPPDPSWIAGLYDDGDHDDAVLAITGAAGLPAITVRALSPEQGTRAPVAAVRPPTSLGPSRITSL